MSGIDRRDYSEVINWLTQLESEQHETRRELRNHIDGEVAHLDHLIKLIGEVKDEVTDIKLARRGEKGFIAGAVFILTTLGAGFATLWDYIINAFR